MLRALLFDIDGTLIDTFEAIHTSMNLAMEEVGVGPLRRDELRPLIGTTVASQLAALRGMSGPVVETIHEAYYRNFADLVRDGVKLYPGVRETLDVLRGYAIGTITTRRSRVARMMLRVGQIEGYFSTIVGGDEVSRPKPHPDLVQHSCDSLGVSPREAVAIGDSPVDTLAGRAAGTRTVAILYGYGDRSEIEEARPEEVINDFMELPAAIERLEGRVR